MGKLIKKRRHGGSRTGPLLPSQVQNAAVVSQPSARRQRARQAGRRLAAEGASTSGSGQANEANDEQPFEGDESTPVPILAKLDNPDIVEKEIGCYAVASIVADNPAHAQDLIQGGVLGKLSACFVHPESVTLRTASASALRSLCLSYPPVLRMLISSNALGVVFAGIHASAVALRSASEGEVKAHYDNYLIQVISVLWSLLEESQEALDAFNSSNCLEALMMCIQPDVNSLDLISVAAQCLYIVTDENTHVTTLLSGSPQNILSLQYLISETHGNLYLRIVGAGILNNIATESSYSEILQATLPVICSTLDIESNSELLAVLPDLRSAVTVYQEAKQNGAIDVGAFEPPISFNQWYERAKSLQLALEILANICITWGEDGTEEDADSEEWDENSTQVTEQSKENLNERLSGMTIQHLKTIGCFTRIFQKTLSPPAEIISVIPNASILPQLETILNIQVRALSCIGNAASGLVSNREEFALLWNHLLQLMGQILSFPSREHVITMVDSMTCLLWQLSKTPLANEVLPETNLAQLTEDIKKLLGHPDCTPEIRTNLLGLLGPVALCSKNLALIEGITRSLFDFFNSAFPAIVSAEALNSLMDIFSDVFYDQVFYALNAPALLTAYLPSFKDQAKQQRKEYPKDVRDRLDETVVNLRRFIDYKKAHY